MPGKIIILYFFDLHRIRKNKRRKYNFEKLDPLIGPICTKSAKIRPQLFPVALFFYSALFELYGRTISQLATLNMASLNRLSTEGDQLPRQQPLGVNQQVLWPPYLTKLSINFAIWILIFSQEGTNLLIWRAWCSSKGLDVHVHLELPRRNKLHFFTICICNLGMDLISNILSFCLFFNCASIKFLMNPIRIGQKSYNASARLTKRAILRKSQIFFLMQFLLGLSAENA